VSQSRLVVVRARVLLCRSLDSCSGRAWVSLCRSLDSCSGRAWVGDGAVLMINAGTCWCLWQRLPIPTEHIYIAQLPRARTQHLMTLYGT